MQRSRLAPAHDAGVVVEDLEIDVGHSAGVGAASQQRAPRSTQLGEFDSKAPVGLGMRLGGKWRVRRTRGREWRMLATPGGRASGALSYAWEAGIVSWRGGWLLVCAFVRRKGGAFGLGGAAFRPEEEEGGGTGWPSSSYCTFPRAPHRCIPPAAARTGLEPIISLQLDQGLNKVFQERKKGFGQREGKTSTCVIFDPSKVFANTPGSVILGESEAPCFLPVLLRCRCLLSSSNLMVSPTDNRQ